MVGVCQHKVSEPVLFMVSADFSPESHFSRQCAGSASPTQRGHTGLQYKGETEGAYTAPVFFLQSQGRATFFLAFIQTNVPGNFGGICLGHNHIVHTGELLIM